VLGSFRQAANTSDRFLISAELTLRRESTTDDLRRQADALEDRVDGFQVTENPYSWMQMSALSAAAILAEHGADPLPSAVTARWIRKTPTGSRIPDEVIDRLEASGDPAGEGIRICAEQMREAAEIPGISGINLMTTGDPGAIPAVIEASGLRS
jgi:5,10-methylenetetrahydrofolate reductase